MIYLTEFDPTGDEAKTNEQRLLVLSLILDNELSVVRDDLSKSKSLRKRNRLRKKIEIIDFWSYSVDLLLSHKAHHIDKKEEESE